MPVSVPPFQFLSTLSLRRATVIGDVMGKALAISIHALLAESDTIRIHTCQYFLISIHALLAESDQGTSKTPHFTSYFYPRSPCGERHDTSSLLKCQVKFLSTLSLRRATESGKDTNNSSDHFYPRSPCGERLTSVVSSAGTTGFLSTLSLRRATQAKALKVSALGISIHALLAESDH